MDHSTSEGQKLTLEPEKEKLWDPVTFMQRFSPDFTLAVCLRVSTRFCTNIDL